MGFCKAHQLDMHGFCGRFDCPCIKKNCRFYGVRNNGDLVRDMDNDKLAAFIEDTCPSLAIKLGGEHVVRSREYIKIWLDMPVE